MNEFHIFVSGSLTPSLNVFFASIQPNDLMKVSVFLCVLRQSFFFHFVFSVLHLFLLLFLFISVLLFLANALFLSISLLFSFSSSLLFSCHTFVVPFSAVFFHSIPSLWLALFLILALFLSSFSVLYFLFLCEHSFLDFTLFHSFFLNTFSLTRSPLSTALHLSLLIFPFLNFSYSSLFTSPKLCNFCLLLCFLYISLSVVAKLVYILLCT